jgi:hypothetical protein
MKKKKQKVNEIPIEEFDKDKQDIREKFIKKFHQKGK